MARKDYYTQPNEKKLEVFDNFIGGMNSVAPNENLSDIELAFIKNKNIGNRGSLTRRHGMVKHIESVGSASGRGYFRYYKQDGTYDEILSVNGTFELNGVTQTVSGMDSIYQTIKPIEAIQFQNKMYFATGTKLVMYDGAQFSVVEPHKPTSLEALYYGFNALHPDPSNYMSDGVSPGVEAAGMTFSKRYGVVNESVTITGHVNAPVGELLQYKLEYRTTNMMEGAWALIQDWGSTKVIDFTPLEATDYQFRFSVRKNGDDNTKTSYLIPKYKVKSSADPNDITPDVANIHKCNRILMHGNRVFLYGDETNKDMVYISHLNNPTYFPVPNCLRFENPKNESLNVLLHYRDRLVAMTDSTIQSLLGKSPLEYERVVLNTDIGCIAPYSAVVVENFIYFLSQDGVYMLKQVGTVEERANVTKIDTAISNMIDRDKNACGIYHNLEYHLVFPYKDKRFRYYNEFGSWVYDESYKLNFVNMWTYGGKLYAQDIYGGDVFKFDETVFTDDGYVFEEEIQTKAYTFGQPYHPKTLRELLVAVSPEYGNYVAKLQVYADNRHIVSSKKGTTSINENGEVVWTETDEPNLLAYEGAILGEWELGKNPLGHTDSVVVKQRLSGKCYQVRLVITQKEDHQNEFFGFAIIFKLKKPK
jgi:hypothetical protein